MSGSQTKTLLKHVAARYVPRRCVYRPKEGFSIPIKHWLAGQFKSLLDQALDVDKLSRQGIFAPRVLAQLRDEHLAGRANHSHILWSVIVFQTWF